MRVLLVSAQFLPAIGGIARSMHRLAKSLVDLGHDVLVITKRVEDRRAPGLGCPSQATVQGIDVTVLPGSWFRSSGFGIGQYAVRQIGATFKPDIVHAYSAFSAAYAAASIARSQKTPLIVSCRGQDVTHTILNHPDRLRLNLKAADHVTYVAGSLSSWPTFIVDPPPGTVIRNGIDASELQGAHVGRSAKRRELGLADNAVVLGAFADFRWKKGLDYLLKVLRRLEDRLNASYRFVLAGRANDRNRLLDLLGPDRLVYVETPSRGELGALFSALDLLLLTSYREGLPNVLLEAMAAGLPVASTAVDGCLEVLSMNESGLLLDPHDPEVAGDAVAELIRAPGRLRQLRKAAATLVQEEFSAERERNQVLALYESLLGHAV